MIELLVVISIIALLLAILMPSLLKAKENTRKVVCANNLRQIGLCTALYAQDYADYFPVTTTPEKDPRGYPTGIDIYLDP